MMQVRIESYDHWRKVARKLIGDCCRPQDVSLVEAGEQQLIFADELDITNAPPVFTAPREFIRLSTEVAYHRDPSRWNLLFRMLWRIKNGEPKLLKLVTDADVLLSARMEKEVRRDAHKMKAFVRFRRVVRDGEEFFIAWHHPDHRIVRKVAPFFSRRFAAMNWTILTSDESVSWNQESLHYHAGVPNSEAPQDDELEQLWLTYYGSIFNPARVKVKMMVSEMPVRHWPTLPETKMIPELLQDAPKRVQQMIDNTEGFAETANHVIAAAAPQPQSLNELATLSTTCRACELHRSATQIVFGQGPADARLVLIGEQPGDQEDRQGNPFVGPAGEILDEALVAAGVDRQSVYITNTVKHFKHIQQTTPRGKRRLHQKPSAREVRCCKPWFEAEWNLLPNAQVLVCLGTTAATAWIGPGFRLSHQRGQVQRTQLCDSTIATWHPAAILRIPDKQTAQIKLAQLTDDLRTAFELVGGAA